MFIHHMCKIKVEVVNLLAKLHGARKKPWKNSTSYPVLFPNCTSWCFVFALLSTPMETINPPKIFVPLITRRVSFPGFQPWSELTVEHAQHEKMHGPSPYGSWSHEWAMVWRECWRLLATWAGYSVVQFCKLWFAWKIANKRWQITGWMDRWITVHLVDLRTGEENYELGIPACLEASWILAQMKIHLPRCLATHPINHHLVKASWSPVFSPNMAAPSAAFAASFEDSSFAWRLPPKKPGVARTPMATCLPQKRTPSG